MAGISRAERTKLRRCDKDLMNKLGDTFWGKVVVSMGHQKLYFWGKLMVQNAILLFGARWWSAWVNNRMLLFGTRWSSEWVNNRMLLAFRPKTYNISPLFKIFYHYVGNSYWSWISGMRYVSIFYYNFITH